jgi:hypothetical protein
MRFFFFIFLLLQIGCATKYVIPGNRFITPETQGGALQSSLEFQQTQGNEFTVKGTSSPRVDEGVEHNLITRSSFLLSTSLFDPFDFFWSHTGGSPSMLGGKFQFIGDPRTAKADGHKMSVALAFGGNDHQTDGRTHTDFTLKGQEFLLLYGYRLADYMLLYSTFSYARYHFSGEITSNDNRLSGRKLDYQNKIKALYLGSEFSFGPWLAKLECGYQQIATTRSGDVSNFIYGYSVGIAW